MNLINYVYIILLFLNSTFCQSQTKGTILYGNSASYVGLVSLYHSSGKLISSSYVKNNKFSINYKLLEPTLCKLKFEKGFVNEYIFLDNLKDTRVTLLDNDSLIVNGSEIHNKWITYTKKVDSLRKELIKNYSLKQKAIKNGDSTTIKQLTNDNNDLSKYAGVLINNSPFTVQPISFFNLHLLTQKGLVGSKEEGDFLEKNSVLFNKYPSYKKILSDWRKLYLENSTSFMNKRFKFYTAQNTSNSYTSDNRFKLIIFWASWCGPCLLEIRELNAMKSLIRDAKVGITYISLDKNKKAWEKSVKKNTIDGINLVASPELLRNYNIKSIPRNFLLNKEDTIILENFNVKLLKEYLLSKKNN